MAIQHRLRKLERARSRGKVLFLVVGARQSVKKEMERLKKDNGGREPAVWFIIKKSGSKQG